jgi:hypothetical protein
VIGGVGVSIYYCTKSNRELAEEDKSRADRFFCLVLYYVFFAYRNSPLLQNIFPGAGGENLVNVKFITSLLALSYGLFSLAARKYPARYVQKGVLPHQQPNYLSRLTVFLGLAGIWTLRFLKISKKVTPCKVSPKKVSP